MDLLGAYSKRSDLVFGLVRVMEQLRVADPREHEAVCSVRSEHAPRIWRISDRLSEADVHSLVSSYQAGVTARELAEQYKISRTSVKQLLREHGVRRSVPTV